MSRIPFSQLRKYIEVISTESERQAAAEEFFSDKSAAGLPFIEENNRVVFLYRGTTEEVFLFGDMTFWSDKKAFSRLADTDVFYLEDEYPSEARLQYWLLTDEHDAPILDPYNPCKIGNGLGLMSELTMPGYKGNPFFTSYQDGREGEVSSLDSYILSAGVLPYEHIIHVYKPEGMGVGPFATVYFQDGLDYLRFAHAPAVMESLMKSGKIPPSIGIFVTPPNLHIDKRPNRSTEYGLNKDYTDFFCNELVPYIEELYPVINDPQKRVVAGDSYGGLASTFIGVSRPDVFRRICSQSGYYSFQNDEIINMVNDIEIPAPRIYFHVGSYEQKIGASFIPEKEQDFTAANFRMKDILEKKGWPCKFNLSSEGHTWGNWRGHLADALVYLMNEDG